MFAYASDHEAIRYLLRPSASDPAESAAFLERCERVWESGEVYVRAITLAGSPLLGTIEARPSKHGAGLGYVLSRAGWGNGPMTEAVQAVVD